MRGNDAAPAHVGKMKIHETIDRNDPQSLSKFEALAKAKVCFAVTDVDVENDFTRFSIRANDYGMRIIKMKLNTFHFAPKEKGENP